MQPENSIRKLWEKNNNNENKLDKLVKYDVINKTINFKKGIYTYAITKNKYIDNNRYVINLGDFPDYLIGMIKVILVCKTLPYASLIFPIKTPFYIYGSSDYYMFESSVDYYILDGEKRKLCVCANCYLMYVFNGGLGIKVLPIYGDLILFIMEPKNYVTILSNKK